jgi:hypothetical protein
VLRYGSSSLSINEGSSSETSLSVAETLARTRSGRFKGDLGENNRTPLSRRYQTKIARGNIDRNSG